MKKTIFLFSFILLLVLPLLVSAHAGEDDSGHHGMTGMMGWPMMMGGSWGTGAFAWIGWIFMILFWVLIIAGIIALIKWLLSQNAVKPGGKSPQDILKERYAKGEISEKEFKRISKEIE